MLPTKEELAERYATFGNDRLLKILHQKILYRKEAVEAAIEELKKRNLPPEQITKFKRAVAVRARSKNIARKSELRDQDTPISFIEKLVCFISGVFLNGIFSVQFESSKVRPQTGAKQRRLYTIAGALSTFIAVFLLLTVANESIIFTLMILIILFGITLAVEEIVGAP